MVRFTDHEMDALAYLVWEHADTLSAILHRDNVESDRAAADDRVKVIAAKLAKISWQPRNQKVIVAYRRLAAPRTRLQVVS